MRKKSDVIMRGGITSGVVYPKAVLSLSEHARFRSVGGTSAGAIAAVITGAAEYNRDGGGYQTIAAIPEDVQQNLLSLFQPSPEVRAVFDSALLIMAGRDRRRDEASNCLLAFFCRGIVVGVALAAGAVALPSYLAALLLLLIGAAGGLTLLI